MSNALITLISLYQKTLSPDHGWLRARFPHGACRFRPTCSEYAKDALRIHGAIRGSGLALRRIGRCHPGSAGGYDPIR